MPDKSVREDIRILWKMARTNELYTFDMFYDDLMGKIRQIVDGCVPEKRSVESWLEENREFDLKIPEENLEIFVEGINQAIDTMKANLEKVWEGKC